MYSAKLSHIHVFVKRRPFHWIFWFVNIFCVFQNNTKLAIYFPVLCGETISQWLIYSCLLCLISFLETMAHHRANKAQHGSWWYLKCYGKQPSCIYWKYSFFYCVSYHVIFISCREFSFQGRQILVIYKVLVKTLPNPLKIREIHTYLY